MARLRRVRLPASLRWRLTMWVAAVMLVAVAAIFVVVYNDTGTELRGQIDRDIAGDTAQLGQSLRASPSSDAAQLTAAARQYMGAQSYSATSTLLFVLIPRAGAVSNHPEVLGVGAPDDGENATEQATENGEAHGLLVPRIGYSVRKVPDVGAMRVLERAVRIGRVHAVVGAGEPLTIIERAQHGVARAFLLAGALTLALALVASYFAGARVSAPLRRLAAIATRVDAGDLAPRMKTTERAGSEVQVLAQAFNHMLDRLAEAFAGQRDFIADASHELRTPLTVIRGQLDVLAAQEDPPAAEVKRVERLVQAEILRMSRLVNDLLVLARAEETDFLHVEDVALQPFVSDLWDGVSLTAKRHYELGAVPTGTLRADPDRLAQALHNLARNAIEHTAADTGLVRLEVARDGADRIRFTVLDDGPGIPSPERERVFERFHRTDSSRSRAAGGAGLGLAIVRAIAEAHGGEVRARDPVDGRGAHIELVLPGFEVGPRAQSGSTAVGPPGAPGRISLARHPWGQAAPSGRPGQD
jgi:two-component system, OmpR family, sensor kinase